MNAAELLDELNRAGATVEIVEGKPRIRGQQIPPALLDQCKAQRDEILAEVQHRKELDRDRYQRVPSVDVPMLAQHGSFPEMLRHLLESCVFRQGRVVHAWTLRRAQEYFALGAKFDDCDWRACVDLIAWQRQATAARTVVDFIAGIEEGAQAYPEGKKPGLNNKVTK